MGSAWIKIFVLTLSECVAPAGKTVCQESQFELEFLTRADCETVLEQMIALKDESASVIVNKDESGCRPSAREQTTYSSLSEVSGTVANPSDWQTPKPAAGESNQLRERYEERLTKLKTCEETEGVAPCKVGEIIIEAAAIGEPVEVWRSGN